MLHWILAFTTQKTTTKFETAKKILFQTCIFYTVECCETRGVFSVYIPPSLSHSWASFCAVWKVLILVITSPQPQQLFSCLVLLPLSAWKRGAKLVLKTSASEELQKGATDTISEHGVLCIMWLLLHFIAQLFYYFLLLPKICHIPIEVCFFLSLGRLVSRICLSMGLNWS